MRKEEYTSSIASGNTNSNYTVENQSFISQITNWFRDFIENAE